MQRFSSFEIGKYYHVYARGVEKREIFLDKSDYYRFITLLYLCNSTENIQLSRIIRNNLSPFEYPIKQKLVSVCIYCLMPNHFHLVLKEIKKDGISLFMQKLLTSFSMYFNKKYERSGPLFTRPFRTKYINDDAYFQYLFAYIHLNPLKLIDKKWQEEGIKDLKQIKNFLNQYPYSSYLDYIGNKRLEQKILSIEEVPDYFNKGDFKNFINNWVEASKIYSSW